MSWDDEDFEAPTKAEQAPVSWEEEEDDEPLLDSWDIDQEEEDRKKKEEAAQKKAEKEKLKLKQAELKNKKLAMKNGDQKMLDIDLVDDDLRNEMLRKAQIEADLNNAADLFGGLGVAGDEAAFDINAHPRELASKQAVRPRAAMTKDTPLTDHPLFQPIDKAQYEQLRKALVSSITPLAEDSLLNYSSHLAIDLIRDLSKPLSIQNIRTVVSTLNVLIKDKEKEERAARLKKSGGTATGGAGKKKAKPAVKMNVSTFKKDVYEDMSSSKYDDFDDDDFM